MRGELGYVGPAWIHRDGAKTEVHAKRFGSRDGERRRWWGVYESNEPIASGRAYMRFSDSTDANVELEATSGRSGRFTVVGGLGDLSSQDRVAPWAQQELPLKEPPSRSS